jgi:hypothetical protein
MPPKIDRRRLIEMEKAAVRGWMEKDSAAVAAAVDPLFIEGDPNDGLLFLLDLAVVTYGAPDPSVQVMPLVGRWDEATGRPVVQTMEDVPLGVATYARLCAAYMAQDVDSVVALYRVLIEHPSPAPLIEAIQTALSQAARRASGVMGSDGFPDRSGGPGADPLSGYGSLQ